MTNDTISKLIHESDILGTFIEVGAGQPVARELFNVAKASATIYKAESPYSKKEQERKYPFASKVRSVSKEFIERVIDAEMASGHSETYHNTYYVSSIQLSDAPEKLTHGWIGLRYKGIEKFYHITITHYSDEREKLISMVGAIGLRILYCKNDLAALKELFTSESAMYSCIDIIEDSTTSYIAETISNLESGLEHPITITKEGKLIRLEDLSRKGNLILMKGSFNPIHNHHLEIMNAAEKQYPDATPCFVISLDTYSKGVADNDSLLARIKMINKLGYNVIVFRNPMFNQAVAHLRKHRFIKDLIIFPLGGDTVNRLIQSSYHNFAETEGETINKNVAAFNSHFENVEFPYVSRKSIPTTELAKLVPHFKSIGIEESGFSSTSVRELFEQEKFEMIKAIVPSLIYDDIIDYLKLTTKPILKTI
jgi:nicotinic acid mononucleotide adenylyltransferase